MIPDQMLRHLSRYLLLSLALVAAINDTRAQSPPPNVIRIVVPGGAGSPPDVVSRIVANELAEAEGWRVIVENRPGALETLAMGEVLKQPADGRALFAMSLPTIAAPALLPNLGLRVEAAFAPVIKISSGANVLVVHPSVPAKSVSELVSILQSQPNKFNFSSGPFGTPAHLIGELFKLRTGTRATHVPYQTTPQRMVDLLSGTNQFDFLTAVIALELVASGKLRALAVTSPKRVATLKDTPTVVEQGFPDLVAEDWEGFAVKSGTPNEIVKRLNEAMNRALAKQKVRDAFANIGAEPVGGTPAEFGFFIKSQLEHWGKVIRDSGIKMPQ
jgi:tripartite-type tricarboxylate transporter receptor subunit TctC